MSQNEGMKPVQTSLLFCQTDIACWHERCRYSVYFLRVSILSVQFLWMSLHQFPHVVFSPNSLFTVIFFILLIKALRADLHNCLWCENHLLKPPPNLCEGCSVPPGVKRHAALRRGWFNPSPRFFYSFLFFLHKGFCRKLHPSREPS